MDGDLPAKDRLPISADHPNSIFTLFAKTHRLNVSEEATSVCSRDLCTDERADEAYERPHLVDERGPRARLAARGVAAGDRVRPQLGLGELGRLRWQRRWRRQRQRKSVRTRGATPELGPAGRRASRTGSRTSGRGAGRRLNFKHTLMPHVPYQFMPLGRRYRTPAQRRDPGPLEPGIQRPGPVDVSIQRHFLQTGFADLLLQELWRHLKREGLWDDS